MVATLTLRPEVLEAAAPQGFALATDVAEWLVSDGVPFRSAHEISGSWSRSASGPGSSSTSSTTASSAGASTSGSPRTCRAVLSVPGALAARATRGGTAPVRVAEAAAARGHGRSAHAEWAASLRGGRI
jgi:argininosuccinate lyase